MRGMTLYIKLKTPSSIYIIIALSKLGLVPGRPHLCKKSLSQVLINEQLIQASTFRTHLRVQKLRHNGVDSDLRPQNHVELGADAFFSELRSHHHAHRRLKLAAPFSPLLIRLSLNKLDCVPDFASVLLEPVRWIDLLLPRVVDFDRLRCLVVVEDARVFAPCRQCRCEATFVIVPKLGLGFRLGLESTRAISVVKIMFGIVATLVASTITVREIVRG